MVQLSPTPVLINRRLPVSGLVTVALLVIVVCGIQIGGSVAAEFLRYERATIMQGEVWRLLSGHAVHLGWRHLLLNIAGLLFMLFGFAVTPRFLLVDLLLLALGVSAGLLIFNPDLAWYVGLSGLLHGLAVLVALWLWPVDRTLAVLLFGGVVIKVVWEQMTGADDELSRQLGGAVIVDAHLYGLVSGAVLGLWKSMWQSMWRRLEKPLTHVADNRNKVTD